MDTIKINTRAMRRARELNGWTCAQTAQRIGISDPAYRAIELGVIRTPQQQTRKRIANAFGVSLAQVIGFEPWDV